MGADVQDAVEVADGKPAAFREAMKRYASGVTIVTTIDSDG
jgi:flavin reductase (DIM6/NTAB) family NADH-FMN oxidoreductase RutF